MMPKNSMVSVIIATLAASERADSLKRSIMSIRDSSSNALKIIVVVNGNRSDPPLCEWLQAQPDIHLEFVSKPSLPNAIIKGRELVETPFFSILDDDDEYLPNAIDARLAVCNNQPKVDLVVSNGFFNKQNGDELFYQNLKSIQLNPLQSLLEANWLASCGGLFRSSSFCPEFFVDYHPYAEWTWLAYKLVMDRKKISVLDEPTFRINDTPGSLSKTSAYREAYFHLFERMLKKTPPRDVVKIIKRKLGAAYHDRSNSELHSGKYISALSNHFKSIYLPGGLRYLAYTRKFLTPRVGN